MVGPGTRCTVPATGVKQGVSLVLARAPRRDGAAGGGPDPGGVPGEDARGPGTRRRCPPPSKAHLLLLSRFLRPRDARSFDGDVHWRAVLGEPPERAVRRLMEQGLLEPAGLAERLEVKFTADELRRLLRGRGLPVCGHKADLARRLATEAPDVAERAVAGFDALWCTDAGRVLAQEYLAAERQQRRQAEEESLRAVREGRLRDAVRVVAEYERQQVFPRGVGIDWDRLDLDAWEALLRRIFACRPGILAGVPEDRLEALRVAAIMELWGTNGCEDGWLPGGFETGARFDPSTAARMIVFHVTHLRDLEELRRAGVKAVRMLGCGEDSCEACRAIAAKVYPIARVPELPHPRCSHEVGCRCLVVPA